MSAATIDRPAVTTNAVTVATPLGPFTIITGSGAVIAAGFTSRAEDLVRLVHPSLLAAPARPTTRETDAAVHAVEAYFAGDVAAITDVPVRQAGAGPFRREVWRQLRLLPPGRPVTYTRLAELSGRPAAVRAAASGCATNAVALFVPCHRVVRSDGGLGGYLWGTELKKRLIAHEGQQTDIGS